MSNEKRHVTNTFSDNEYATNCRCAIENLCICCYPSPPRVVNNDILGLLVRM